jgi:hypothetical protein
MRQKPLTPEILAAALQGLEAQQVRMESQIVEIKRMLGARAQAPRPKRKMSAAARKRIAAAQTERWAEYHRKKAEPEKKAKPPAAAIKTPGSKRKLSAAGRKRIAAAARKRWAEYNRRKAETAKAKNPAVVRRAAPKKAAAQPAAEGGSE